MVAYIDIIDTCKSATWNTQTITDITQGIFSPLYTQVIPAFTVSTGAVNTVDCLSRTYTLVSPPSFVTIDGANLLIKVQTTDLSQVGTYSVKLSCKLDNYPDILAYEVPFTIKILPC